MQFALGAQEPEHPPQLVGDAGLSQIPLQQMPPPRQQVLSLAGEYWHAPNAQVATLHSAGAQSLATQQATERHCPLQQRSDPPQSACTVHALQVLLLQICAEVQSAAVQQSPLVHTPPQHFWPAPH